MTRTVALEAAPIAEWDAEDLMASRLAGGLEPAEAEEARAMLDAVRIDLPATLDATELVQFSRARAMPFDLTLAPDSERLAFHLVELPVNVLVPDDRRLVRLRVRLTLGGEQAACHDLFPTDRFEERVHDVGAVSVDLGQALTFLCPVPAVSQSLGLQLEAPLRWTSTTFQVRTSGRLSNPVEWYITDRAISQGFVAYMIVRAPHGQGVAIHAELACELRRSGLGVVLKATYRGARESYRIGP